MSDKILKEQLAYYRARAEEYDESIQQTGRFASPEPLDPEIDREWAQAVEALHALPHCERVLELACGTGLWTRELLRVGQFITALDGAPEMLDVNRRNLGDSRVVYQTADLFEWEPDGQYDLVFFAFWLSHVPPDRLGGFLDKVAQAIRPGGYVFIVDEPKAGRHLSGEVEQDQTQQRNVHDGRSFQIVKVYYDPADIQAALAERGFGGFDSMSRQYFFYLAGQRNH